MNLQMELWQLITLLLAFIAFLGATAKMMLGQFNRAETARSQAEHEARQQDRRYWEEKFGAIAQQIQRESTDWQRLERDFLRFQAELPVIYVRREDYVRNQTVIEAKLDSLALKLENMQLKGAMK